MGSSDKIDTAVADTQQEAGGSAEAAEAPAPANVPVDPPASSASAAPAEGEADRQSGEAAQVTDKPEDSGDSPESEESLATPVTKTAPPRAPAKDDTDKKSSADDTVATAAADDDQEEPKSPAGGADGSKPVAIVASNKRTRPPYKYDPNKITLRFLFANRDGLTVTVECNPSDTVGEVKGALLSVWPEDLPDCEGGELLRLVCMGRGFLMPDTRTLADCQIPVFQTHPTPVNVSVKPNVGKGSSADPLSKSGGQPTDTGAGNGANSGTQQASQGCACIIL